MSLDRSVGHRGRRAVSAVSAVAAGALAVTPGSAMAGGGAVAAPESQPSPYTRADPAGDVPAGAGDVTSIRVVNGSPVRLVFRTRTGADPSTSAGWRDTDTVADWRIFFDAGTTVDAHVKIRNDGGSVVATLYKAVPPPPAPNPLNCPCVIPVGPVSHVGGNGYSVEVGDQYLLDPFKAQLAFTFDPPNRPVATDRAPDTRPTPFITGSL